MIRFLIPDGAFHEGQSISLDAETTHYLTRVHRLNEGCEAVAFDGLGLNSLSKHLLYASA